MDEVLPYPRLVNFYIMICYNYILKVCYGCFFNLSNKVDDKMIRIILLDTDRDKYAL